jgi:hypothetical protein
MTFGSSFSSSAFAGARQSYLEFGSYVRTFVLLPNESSDKSFRSGWVNSRAVACVGWRSFKTMKRIVEDTTLTARSAENQQRLMAHSPGD